MLRETMVLSNVEAPLGRGCLFFATGMNGSAGTFPGPGTKALYGPLSDWSREAAA